MNGGPRILEDLAGLAGGAISALAGAREEIEQITRRSVDEMIHRLDLVRREELAAVQEMVTRARTAHEAMELRISALEAALAAK